MTRDDTFPALVVRRDDAGVVSSQVEEITVDDLPPGDVLIQVACSSLNFKDALASQAHPGVAPRLPHVPGIDCAGRVAESSSPEFCPSDPVLVTGYELGAPRLGGYSAYVRVPAEWIVRLPAEWTPEQAMTLGTAGFTAAQCVQALQHHGIMPGAGEVVVTGATGGVGSIAVALLAKLGYEVAAVTGKPEHHDLLRELGARHILDRAEVDDRSDKPLLESRWAGAVDTVGGNVLGTLLRSTKYRGCVTACGLVAGVDVPLTVYPLLLRGVTLCGIDSAKCPREPRLAIWHKLATDWRLDNLEPLVREVTLSELPATIAEMLAGKAVGRTLVRPRK
jgi:acrylyl-CoA reductase (NADPH)